MAYNLLINGVYWGYNPLTNHLLTSWDIQDSYMFAKLLLSLKFMKSFKSVQPCCTHIRTTISWESQVTRSSSINSSRTKKSSYSSSHNHGNGKWVPGRWVACLHFWPFSTSRIVGKRVTRSHILPPQRLEDKVRESQSSPYRTRWLLTRLSESDLGPEGKILGDWTYLED